MPKKIERKPNMSRKQLRKMMVESLEQDIGNSKEILDRLYTEVTLHKNHIENSSQALELLKNGQGKINS